MQLHDAFIESPGKSARFARCFDFPVFDELWAIASTSPAPEIGTLEQINDWNLSGAIASMSPAPSLSSPLFVTKEERYYKNTHHRFWQSGHKLEGFIEFRNGSDWFSFLQDHVATDTPVDLTISSPMGFRLPTFDLHCQPSGVGFGIKPYRIICHLINFGIRFEKYLPVTTTTI